MQLQPALHDSAPDPRAELPAAFLQRVEEGIIDLLDVNPAVLHRLDAGSQLNELPRGDFRIGKRAFGHEFHCGNQNLKPMLDDLARPGMSCQFGTICTDPAAPAPSS